MNSRIAQRVLGRYLTACASERVLRRFARMFPTEEALKAYLAEHPKANPANHSVAPHGAAKPKKPRNAPSESKPKSESDEHAAERAEKLQDIAGALKDAWPGKDQNHPVNKAMAAIAFGKVTPDTLDAAIKAVNEMDQKDLPGADLRDTRFYLEDAREFATESNDTGTDTVESKPAPKEETKPTAPEKPKAEKPKVEKPKPEEPKGQANPKEDAQDERPKDKAKSEGEDDSKVEYEPERDLPEGIDHEKLDQISAVLGKKFNLRELNKMNGHGALPEGYAVEVRNIRATKTQGEVTSITLTARVMFQNQKCGRVFRRYHRKGDPPKLTVSHDEFYLDKEHQGSGVGKAVFNSQIDAYEKLGVDKVELVADNVGKYVWSKAGFEWTDEKQLEGVKKTLRKKLSDEYKLDGRAIEKIMSHVKTGEDMAHLEVDGKKFGKEALIALTFNEIAKFNPETGYLVMSQSPSKIKRL